VAGDEIAHGPVGGQPSGEGLTASQEALGHELADVSVGLASADETVHGGGLGTGSRG
jgi:hypothetical protein